MVADLALWRVEPGWDPQSLRVQIDAATGRWATVPGLVAKAWVLSGNRVGAMTWWQQQAPTELLPPNLIAQELGRVPDERQAFEILGMVRGVRL